MPSRWTGPVLRAVVALAAVALALTTARGYESLRASRAAETAGLERDGATPDTAALAREPDADGVRLRAVRALLAAELDPARHQGLPPEQAARESAARMAAAAETARGVLALRPASWEAALVTGAATYLAWSQARDPRLFTAYRQWEAPLEAALRLAPAQREPVRFLAAAYLEIWPALSPRKREIAHHLLAEVFREPGGPGPLLVPWLDTAADRGEAFAVLPDDPEAWEKVERIYAERRDLAGLTEARQRRERALLSRLRRDLLLADRLREQGDEGEARQLYLSVAGRARPEARYLGLLQSALERCPPGPVDAATAGRLAPHLARALDRCLFASCDLPPASLKRLAHFVRDQEPSQAALAALFADDLQHAALYERHTEGLGTEPWAPYLIAKARVLAARGQVDEARQDLSLVHLSWQGGPLYWQAQAEVARAAGDAAAGARAAARLAGLSRRAWGPQEWTWHRGTARLEMMTAAPAEGITVTFDQVPANGALVELRLDGAAVGRFPLRPPAPSGRVAAPLGRGLHVLEVESLDGSGVLPGMAELR
jgi:hypothetical protein